MSPPRQLTVVPVAWCLSSCWSPFLSSPSPHTQPSEYSWYSSGASSTRSSPVVSTLKPQPPCMVSANATHRCPLLTSTDLPPPTSHLLQLALGKRRHWLILERVIWDCFLFLQGCHIWLGSSWCTCKKVFQLHESLINGKFIGSYWLFHGEIIYKPFISQLLNIQLQLMSEILYGCLINDFSAFCLTWLMNYKCALY